MTKQTAGELRQVQSDSVSASQVRLPAGRATFAVKEVARILGIGSNQAYAAVARGELPALRIGGRILITRATLERILG